MTVDPPVYCPGCGEIVQPGSPLGQCPTCIVGLALDANPKHHSSTTRSQPPSCQELSTHFPSLEIIQLLGVGGMGAVYKARQPKLEREIALKILSLDLASDPEFKERFFREARALAKLNHPNIVAVYDVGQTGPYMYIFMEYIEGASLRELLRLGKIELSEALRVVPKICEAIQYAHDKGIIHRDIKPENILLNELGVVKIADFGLAKLASQNRDSLTATDVRMGTVQYMAPEQISNTATADHRVDIYSLGVTFYEILTGELPTVDYQPPSRKSSVNARVDRIVERSLKSVPDERYQRAADMQLAVERLAFQTGRWWGFAWGVFISTGLLVVAVIAGAFLRRSPETPLAHSIQDPSIASRAESDLVTPLTLHQSTNPLAELNTEGTHLDDILSLHSSQWSWSEPVNLGQNVNSSSVDSQPCLSADGLTLIFGSNRQNPNLNKPQDLWQCRRNSTEDRWEPAERLTRTINGSAIESEPCLSADGLSLIFTSDRPGGFGGMDLWMSRRAKVNVEWETAENLGAPINTAMNEGGATLSGNGKTLYFHKSNQNSRRSHLWTSVRKNTGEAFGIPTPLGTVLEGDRAASDPHISRDGRILLWTCRSSRDNARFPAFDLFQSVRTSPEVPFPKGMPVDAPVNTSDWEIGPSLSSDGRTLLFESVRPGGLGLGDLWMSHRVPRPNKQIAPDGTNFALAFDGATTAIEVPTLHRDRPDSFTLELWVRGPRPKSALVVFVIGGPGRCQINIEPAGWRACELFLPNGMTTAADFEGDSVWRHLAYVIDDAEGVFYADGKEVGRSPREKEPIRPDAIPLSHSWFGAHPGLDNQSLAFHFKGEIDEMRLSRGARYRAPFKPAHRFEADAETLALYHFDDAPGDRLKDASGNQHDGIIRAPNWVRIAR